MRRNKIKKAPGPALSWGTGLLLFLVLSFGVFFFSPESRVQAIHASGNYYYTRQQIYDLARTGVGDCWLFSPDWLIEKRLEADPVIDSAEVSRNGRTLNIEVTEKMIVGRYLDENGNSFLMDSQGQEIPVESTLQRNILTRVPILTNISVEQRQMIAEAVRQKPLNLTRQVFEKIAEITPWTHSYNKNMFKLTMQDGTLIFTDAQSLPVLDKYKTMLSDLKGGDVCLKMYRSNSDMEKEKADTVVGTIAETACSEYEMTQDERAENYTIPKDVLGIDLQLQPEEPAKTEQEQPADSSHEQQAGQSEQQNQNADQPETPAPSQDAQLAQQAGDWQVSEWWDLQYSPSTGLYRNPYDGTLYRYSETSGSFVQTQ